MWQGDIRTAFCRMLCCFCCCAVFCAESRGWSFAGTGCQTCDAWYRVPSKVRGGMAQGADLSLMMRGTGCRAKAANAGHRVPS